MTDEQIIRARVLMAEQGIHADDLTERQVVGLVRSLGGIFCDEWAEALRQLDDDLSPERLKVLQDRQWPRGNFDPTPGLGVFDVHRTGPVPDPSSVRRVGMIDKPGLTPVRRPPS